MHPGQQPPPHFYPSRFPNPQQRPPMRQPGPPGPGGPPAFSAARQSSPRSLSPNQRPREQEDSGGEPAMPSPQDLPKGPATVDEISLRPRNFAPAFRPNIPSMLPPSAQGPGGNLGHVLGPRLGNVVDVHAPQPAKQTTNLVIKQVPAQEKPKKEEQQQKKKAMTKGEVKEAVVSYSFVSKKQLVLLCMDLKICCAALICNWHVLT